VRCKAIVGDLRRTPRTDDKAEPSHRRTCAELPQLWVLGNVQFNRGFTAEECR
jgi:hypothetical protein